MINFTEKAKVPLKIIYLHGIWRIVSIPQYLNGLVVSGHEKGKGKKNLKMEIKYEIRFKKNQIITPNLSRKVYTVVFEIRI